jgi:hypothetical protein
MTTEAELIIVLKRELMDLSSEFTDDNFADAVDDAERELGWTLPQSLDFNILWLKRRTKRHLFYNFMTGNLANSFQYEQVHLEQGFKNFRSLIEMMDKEFETALADSATDFAGVSVSNMFGTKIDAGFQYNEAGEDTTYEDTNEVLFTPTEVD